ncbi:diacylglycerol kinase [Neotabrizicola sp. VNH66]|uniref:diacylglycerol kinase n=1 Tax=Neotabrizicola sp. VNH66 TaxID=3400918 RepID=UPI003C0F82CE
MHFIRAEARRLANTCIWSWQGWRAAWASEKSLRQWTLANVLSAALAFALDLTPGERGVILGLGLLVLAAELFNTAIEEVVDVLFPGPDPRAKKAKDCGSAGVALAALAAGAAWAVILTGLLA